MSAVNKVRSCNYDMKQTIFQSTNFPSSESKPKSSGNFRTRKIGRLKNGLQHIVVCTILPDQQVFHPAAAPLQSFRGFRFPSFLTLRQIHPSREYYPVLGTTRAGYPTSGRGPVPNLKSGSGEQIGAVRQLPGAQLTGPMRGRAIACHSANLTIQPGVWRGLPVL